MCLWNVRIACLELAWCLSQFDTGFQKGGKAGQSQDDSTEANGAGTTDDLYSVHNFDIKLDLDVPLGESGFCILTELL